MTRERTQKAQIRPLGRPQHEYRGNSSHGMEPPAGPTAGVYPEELGVHSQQHSTTNLKGQKTVNNKLQKDHHS